ATRLLRLDSCTPAWPPALLSDRLATTHPSLAIVAINSAALEPYPFLLPVDRGLQADLVETVLRAGARAVALDFYYTKGTIQDADDRLQRALTAADGKRI